MKGISLGGLDEPGVGMNNDVFSGRGGRLALDADHSRFFGFDFFFLRFFIPLFRWFGAIMIALGRK